MKRNLFISILTLVVFTATAQKSDTLKGLAADTLIFTSVQQEPEFPTGLDNFYRLLMMNIRYPARAREHHTQGRVIVTMIIEKDGSLSQVKVVRGIGDGCDEESVRVIKLSPPWKPGMQNGRPVRVAYSIPISFRLTR